MHKPRPSIIVGFWIMDRFSGGRPSRLTVVRFLNRVNIGLAYRCLFCVNYGFVCFSTYWESVEVIYSIGLNWQDFPKTIKSL